MATNRTRLYAALVGSVPLQGLLMDDDLGIMKVFQASALGTRLLGYEGNPPTPFVTYRMHTDFPLNRGLGRREYVQVWANDDPGDYSRIDEILEEARRAVEAIPSSEDFLEARWIETGVDLRDDAMGTINRYIRFQFTNTLRERT